MIFYKNKFVSKQQNRFFYNNFSFIFIFSEFIWNTVFYLVLIFFSILVFFSILLYSASFTLVERKLMSLFQRREGPDKVGFEGIGQPLADGLKLIKKETLSPKDTPSSFIFFIAPAISLTVSLTLWSTIPFNSKNAFVYSDFIMIFFLAISSIGAYGVIFSGWASNNKYALMGSFRSVAQFISYEIIFSIIFMPISLFSESLNFYDIIFYQIKYGWFIFYLIPFFIVFSVVALAETNRTPFDLPEAEAELVSGFNVEYSSLLFASFFLAEYSSMGLISCIFVICFLGGWSNNYYFSKINFNFEDYNHFNFFFFDFYSIFVFAIKTVVCCFFFVFIRAAVPRKRFDQLIQLCWKILFPLVFSFVFFITAIFYSFNNYYHYSVYTQNNIIKNFSKDYIDSCQNNYFEEFFYKTPFDNDIQVSFDASSADIAYRAKRTRLEGFRRFWVRTESISAKILNAK